MVEREGMEREREDCRGEEQEETIEEKSGMGSGSGKGRSKRKGAHTHLLVLGVRDRRVRVGVVEGSAAALDAVVSDVPLVRHELPLAQVGVVAGRGQKRGRIDGRLEARLAVQPYMDGFHEEGLLLAVSKPSSVH